MSLRARILLLVLIAALLPAAAVLWHLLDQRDRDVAEARRNLGALARNAGEALEAKIQGAQQLLFGLSRSRALDTGDGDACSAHLAAVVAQYPQYYAIGTVQLNGDVHCNSLRSAERYNLADRDYFKRALASSGPVAEPVMGRVAGNAILQVALAARDGRGGIGYVLFAALDLDQFARRLAAAQPYPDTLVTLWDGAGTLLSAHPPMQGRAPAGTRHAESALFRFARSGRSGDTGEFAGLQGISRVWALGTLAAMPRTGLTLVLGVPSAALRADAERRMRTTLAIVACAVLLALAAAWMLTEFGVRRPVGRILSAAARFTGGDLRARVGAPYPGGEIGTLMQALDATAAQIEAQQQKIIEQSAALARGNRALGLVGAVRRALLHAGTEEALLDEVCGVAVEGGGYPLARIGYAEHDAARSVRTMARRGPRESETLRGLVSWGDGPTGRGPTGSAIRTGETVVQRDLPDNPDYAAWQVYAKTHGYVAALGLPLIAGGAVLGALSLFSTERDAFSPAEVEQLEGLAAEISLGIAALRGRDAVCRADEAARRQAAAEESNRFKSEFIARMAHELRTPLNAVLGFAELIADADAAGMRSHALEIRAAGERLRLTMDDIFAFAEIESGRAPLAVELVAPVQLAQAALRGAAPLAARRGVTLASAVPDGLPQISVDPRRVRLALGHLLGNAVKYSANGGTVTLAARVAPRAEGAPMLEFAVADTGEGIAAADLPKLFQPFVQLEPALTRRHGGTGLGLALVKRIAELHGGEAGVQSEPGKGSVFRLRLPLDLTEVNRA